MNFDENDVDDANVTTQATSANVKMSSASPATASTTEMSLKVMKYDIIIKCLDRKIERFVGQNWIVALQVARIFYMRIRLFAVDKNIQNLSIRGFDTGSLDYMRFEAKNKTTKMTKNEKSCKKLLTN